MEEINQEGVERVKSMEERWIQLEKNQAETGAYIQTILEDLREVKGDVRDIREQIQEENQRRTGEHSLMWQEIISDLIRLASLSVVILGAIVGVVKLMGS